MTKTTKIIAMLSMVCVSLIFSSSLHAQISFQSEYLGNAGYSQKGGELKGSQAVMVQRLNANLPLAVKVENQALKYFWGLNVQGTYAHGSGTDAHESPLFDDIKSGSVGLSYMRPLNKKWTMLTNVSVGASTDHDIGSHRMNYGAVCSFMYKFNNGIRLTLGGAVTDKFGGVLVLPVIMFDWRKDYSKYYFTLRSVYNIKATFGYHLTDNFDLTAVLNKQTLSYQDKLEENDDKTVFNYSYNIIGIQPVWKLPHNLKLKCCLGYSFGKKVNLKERKISQMFKKLFKYDVDPSPYVSIGLTYNLGRR